MFYYKAILQYDGTNYCGFQWQKDIPTVQNDLNQALFKLLDGKVTTMGASRTDTGVHAIEQVVKISSEQEIECGSFLANLSEVLPSQLRCLRLDPCDGGFRPASDHSSKEYRYFFTNKLRANCDAQKFIVNHPYALDLELMKLCAQMIVGRHDFVNFCSAGSNVKTTIRDVSVCELSEVEPRSVLPQSGLFPLPQELEQCFQLKIIGTGFLKQMVRHLMRGLWLVGGGKISPDEFYGILNGPKRSKRLWTVAPPNGLFLYSLNKK